MNELEAIEKAVKILGGQTETARFLTEKLGIEVKQAHVWNWIKRGQRLPERYVLAIQYGTYLKGQPILAEQLNADWHVFYNSEFQISANDPIFHKHNDDCNYLVG